VSEDMSIEISAPPTLRRGDRGLQVEILQRLLEHSGRRPGEAAGEFGESTEAAVLGLQQEAGLDATGAADGPTWRALLAASGRKGARGLAF